MLKPRVLLIDDHEQLVYGVIRLLAGYGYDVEAAPSGEKGLAVLRREQRFDAILLDYQMGGMNGLDVLKVLQSDPQLRHIPVIFLTASILHGEEGLAAGATSFLLKPCRIDLMRRTIDEVCPHAVGGYVPNMETENGRGGMSTSPPQTGELATRSVSQTNRRPR